MEKTIKILLISLSIIAASYVATIVNPPEPLKTNLGKCPSLLNMDNLATMIIRVVDNAKDTRTFINRCLYQHLAYQEGVKLIDRKNEKIFIDEMTRQSEIPSTAESTIPIGEMLSPTHLLIVEPIDTKLSITLSNIKSGTIIQSKVHDILLAREYVFQNFTKLFKIVSFVITLAVLLLLLYPIFIYLRKREAANKEIEILQHDYKIAVNLIQNGNIHEGSRLLTNIAQSNYRSTYKQKAISTLRKLADYKRHPLPS